MKNESWDVRMDGDMVIAGLSERTREAYLRAVRQLSKFHGAADPGRLEEQDVKAYLLWLRTEKRAAPGTLRIAFNGIRFFYRQTCPRDWITLLKFRIPKETKLPTVLTVAEVHRIMNAIRRERFRAYFWTVYSCGLRLNEALALQVGDIDAQRMRIHVHRVRHRRFVSGGERSTRTAAGGDARRAARVLEDAPACHAAVPEDDVPGRCAARHEAEDA